MNAVRRFAIAVAIGTVFALVAVSLNASLASAGGSHITPVKDRYEPGDEATLVGYIEGNSLVSTDELFYAFLVPRPDHSPDGGPLAPPSGTPLGALTVERTGAGGYLSLRVSITFRIASDLVPGLYDVTYCNASCDEGLGDLVGGYLYVGVDPESSITREWALDEPEIAGLAPNALISGPGFALTAAAIRAGQVPPESSQFLAFARAVPTSPAASAAPAGEVARANDDRGAAWLVFGVCVFASALLAMIGIRRIRRARLRPPSEASEGVAGDVAERELEPL